MCGHSRAFSGPAPDRRTEGSKQLVLIGCDYFCVSSLCPSVRPSIHTHTRGYVFMSNLYSNRLEKSSTLSFFLSALLLPTWLSQGICRSQLCTYPTGCPCIISGLSCSSGVWICAYAGEGSGWYCISCPPTSPPPPCIAFTDGSLMKSELRLSCWELPSWASLVFLT